MNENLPILYRNVMDGLPSDFARDVFLWAAERPNEDCMCYRAERFAREAQSLVEIMGPLTNASFDILEKQTGLKAGPEVRADLMNFALSRHANSKFGGNVKPSYKVPA